MAGTRELAELTELEKCLEEIKIRLKRAMYCVAEINLSGFETLASMYDEASFLANECHARIVIRKRTAHNVTAP